MAEKQEDRRASGESRLDAGDLQLINGTINEASKEPVRMTGDQRNSQVRRMKILRRGGSVVFMRTDSGIKCDLET